MKIKGIVLSILLISGCTTTPNKIDIVDIPDTNIILHPPKPVGVSLEVPTFYVVNATTCQKVVEENGPLFSMDTLGYQQMARNIQELRRYILELQNVVKYYEEAIDIMKNDTQTDR